MAQELKLVDLPQGFGQTRGSEHEVWLADAGMRVIKATHSGEFGRKFGPARFATQEEYLERIGLINEEFALDWQIEGVCGAGRSLRVVTSQPVFTGKPPSLMEIRQFMCGHGFVFHRTRFGDAWFRKEDGLLVSDAEPKNAVVTTQGIMPFDFLIAKPAPELLAQAGIR
ncbi:MAG: hypothetical protein K9N47_04555 [Prosthecobacter sp.]|uniref:putative polyvalent protein kinase domain-containing protein n=1 Tax=Prosthecobacter sp. TaxID=1965333 RepID=UPI0025D22858|nr:hypothetical protein [Prosthecobacter sp.]MCF7785368.1 hypothetical protein [Prosthecobacter sp.]